VTVFLVRRLIAGIVIIILVSLLVFTAMRLLPGDPILMLITPTEKAEYTEQQADLLRHEFGLDRPLVVQYVDWIGHSIRGDLGTSIVYRKGVSSIIQTRLPVTVHLGVIALVISVLIGIPVGTICAMRRNSWIDNVLTVFSNIGITVPIFWLGLIMMYFFGLKLKILPVFGYTAPFSDFWLSSRQAIMPVICLAVYPMAALVRQSRSSMLEVMRQDYIRTAWSKGLRERLIVSRHALKNGLIPIVTLLGMNVSTIVGGAVLTETVFNIPGMGRLAVEAVINQDFPVVQGTVLVISIAVILSNLIVDVSYGWLDPRVRYS
jgi:peptide/nickel transport system permease protein